MAAAHGDGATAARAPTTGHNPPDAAAAPRLGFRAMDEGFHRDYRVARVLGVGGFGEVRLVEHRRTGHRFALKRISKFSSTPAVFWATEDGARAGSNDVFYARRGKRILAEVEAMRRLRGCLNICHLYHAYEDKENAYLLLEFCRGGEVLQRFAMGTTAMADGNAESSSSKVTPLQGYVHSEANVARAMRAVLLTLMQCHARGIQHRDVKPSNFLYLTTAPGSPLKAVDFGLAIFFNPAAVATYEAERARGTPASELGPAPLSLGDVGLDGSPWYQGMDISTFA